MPEEPSRGPHGYPDYQRVENLDGPLLIPNEVHKQIKGASFTTGSLDCGRYAATVFRSEILKGAYKLVVSWDSGSPSFLPVGKKEWRQTLLAGQRSFIRLSNLGPGISVSAEGLEEPNELEFLALLTNRQPTQEAIPTDPMVHRQSFIYKAKEQRTFQIPRLATGTAHFGVSVSNAGAATIAIAGTNGSGLSSNIGFQVMPAGLGAQFSECVAPLEPLEVIVVNGEVEQTVTSVVVISP